MTFFDDFAAAVEAYPTTDVTIAIVDVAAEPPSTPGSISISETWRFKVRVTNNGHLNMTGVSLHVHGLNGAEVRTTPLGTRHSTITVGNMTVNGGSSQDTASLFFTAPTVTKPAGTSLVSAHIVEYSANLDHMFTNHTNGSTSPSGEYSAQVWLPGWMGSSSDRGALAGG